jgi:hypothetical protein
LETGFERLLREKGPIRNAILGEGQGVPSNNFRPRIHLPFARERAKLRRAAARLLDWFIPVLGHAGHLSRAFDVRSERALFATSQTVFALRDRAAGLRNHIPERRDFAGSTLIAYGAVGIMAAILINDLLGPTPANSSVSPVVDERPIWIEIVRPHSAFALESPALDGLNTTYSVRHHRLGGGRKDELTFGDASAERGAYMRVSLYRPGSEGMAEPDPFEAVIALATESGIDAELRETDRKLRTKFGALPIVAMNVSGSNGPRACLATASGWSDPRFGLVAWLCNPGPEIVAQGQFACLLDRLALMSSGNDDQLAEFFAHAELKRSFCNLQSSFVSPTPHRPDDWIHAKRRPQLRGRLTAR